MHYLDCLVHLKAKGEELLDVELGLDRMHSALDQLDNCQMAVPTVLVAGTNGKGSTARCLASICQQAGLRVGLFTSPHLVRIRERMAISGRLVDRHSFARHYTRAVEAAGRARVELTFFETLTAAAFSLFSNRQVDLAVLEVGLGGRLDATNVTEPLMSILTPISYDHQLWLGSDLSTIAKEKLGIVRPGRPVVSASQLEEVEETVRLYCARTGAPLTSVASDIADEQSNSAGRTLFSYKGLRFSPGMRGRSQVVNASVAIESALGLRSLFPEIDDASLQGGIRRAFSRGVLHRIPLNPPVLLDGGHNPAAAAHLAAYVESHTAPPRRLLFGVMQDKDAAGVLEPLIPLFDRIHLTAVDSPRAADPNDLKKICPSGIVFSDPLEAYRSLRAGEGLVVVAGSFYLAGLVAKEEGL